jgi:hypothetical protein
MRRHDRVSNYWNIGGKSKQGLSSLTTRKFGKGKERTEGRRRERKKQKERNIDIVRRITSCGDSITIPRSV